MLKKGLSLLLLSLLVSGCNLLYRIDVQQGNLVTREMVAQLKPGMPEQSVRFIMGTPLLTSIFHQHENAQRWDYFYSLRKGWDDAQTHKLTLIIENGVLAKIDGDTANLPTQQESERVVPAFEDKPLL